MSEQLQKHSMWVGIWQAALGLFIGIIVSAFIFGRQAGDLRQKINDVVAWKAESQPRIERIDRGGSISFENFKTHYDEEQGKQYKRLEKLEEQVGHLETLNFRVDILEKNHRNREEKP
jgi:hypothetical protein